ncbi:unnamed protein product [Auanema sp. JU1783]|nr:unnamed protein product [Auanema sp. JU1783]
MPHILFHQKLRSLRINRCGLLDLTPHSLLPTPGLVELDLSDNKLETLPPTVLRSLKFLKVINLAGNRIRDLSQLSWILADGVQLERIDLSRNPLAIAMRSTILPPVRQLFLSDANLIRLNSSLLMFRESTACPYREDCRSLLLDAHDMSHLTTLVLSKNPDLHIEESGLNLFENITYMDLSQTLLPTSFPTWLEQRSRLTNLNISHSDLSLAEDEWSSCGEHLTSLDISGMRIKRINLATDCPLKFLGATDNLLEITQIRAVGLEVLSLDRNLLTSFPQPPPGISLEHLHTLSLSNNLLTTLTADTLSHLPSLQHLDLSHNQLSEVDKLAFPSVGLQLISLDISFNQLSVLPHPVLPSLLMLDASSNALVTIDPVLFAGLPQLQHLRLSNNVLLFTRCQTDCWSDHLDELTGLVELDLSNCALSRSLPLSHLISLRSLYLRGNQILNVDATDLPKSVYTLDLGDNRIHFTSNFSHLRTLNDLRVDGNPLRCDCSLFDVVDHLMNQSEITNPDLYFCYSASWQYPLLPYLASVKPCDYYQQRTFIPMLVSTVAFAIIVVSTFILSFVLWKRYIPRLWHFYKRLDLQVAEDDELPVRL